MNKKLQEVNMHLEEQVSTLTLAGVLGVISSSAILSSLLALVLTLTRPPPHLWVYIAISWT